MMNPVRELKVRAELLQHAARTCDEAALERLRMLPSFARQTSRRCAAPRRASSESIASQSSVGRPAS